MFPDPLKSAAILIGTSKFADPDLPSLEAVERNLVDLGATLSERHALAIPADRCLKISNPEYPHDFLDPLAEAASEVTDLLLIYYSGHGILEGDEGELYLSLRQTIQKKPWTSIPFQMIARFILDHKATTKMLILDCSIVALH